MGCWPGALLPTALPPISANWTAAAVYWNWVGSDAPGTPPLLCWFWLTIEEATELAIELRFVKKL